MKSALIVCLIFSTAAAALAQTPAAPKPTPSKRATPAAATPAASTPAAATPSPQRPAAAAAPTPPPSPDKREFLSQIAAKTPPEMPGVVTKQEVSTSVPTDPPGQLVAAFFDLLAKGQLEKAYEGLTRGSKMIEKPEDLRVLKQKTKEAIEVFGTIVGYELFESKPVGSRLLRRTYLSLGSEYPLRWRFYFYNANSRWRLIDLRVDDKLTGIFDEAPEARGELP